MSYFNKRENLDFIVVLTMGLIVFAVGIWFNLSNPHLTVKYDCSLAEISPDYPLAVKEQCRKLMMERIK
jgi:hypothetical protein